MKQSQSDQIQLAPNRSSEPLRLNVDNSNQKATLIFWVLFAILLLGILITSNFTPEAFIIKSNQSELAQTHHRDCNNPVEFDNGLLSCKDFGQQNPKIGLIMRDLSTLHQFAQINLVVIPRGQKQGTIKVNQMINVQLLSLKRKVMRINQNKEVIGFEKSESIRTMSNLSFDYTDHPLQSVQLGDGSTKTGYQLNLGYYRSFHTADALLVITFLSYNDTISKDNEIFAQAILMNPKYTIFMLCMRGTFLFIMFVSLAIYYSRTKGQPIRYSCVEQKVVMRLSVGVILFNDPYYFVQIFWPNIISVFFSTVFVTSFLVLLLLSWVQLLQKIQVELTGNNFTPSTVDQAIFWILGAFYFLLIFAFNIRVGYYSWNQQPIIPAHQVFGLMFTLSGAVFMLIFAYIIWLYFKILQKCNRLVWRNRLLLSFNAYFILLLMIFMCFGLFSVYDESSQKFEILYASLNLYVLYMQYMYSRPFIKQKAIAVNQQFEQIHSSVNTLDDQIISGQVTIDLQSEFKRKQGDLVNQ